jgi:hypothetical protein
MRMQKDICIALPPHLPDSQATLFEDLLRSVFDTTYSKCLFLPQPQTSLLSLNPTHLEQLRPGVGFLSCHMEEEITVSYTKNDKCL